MTTAALGSAKRRTAWIAAVVAALMVGLAFASVPLYRAFCQATGYGGTTQRAEAGILPDRGTLRALGGRTIKIRFDGNTTPGMPWRFGPDQHATTIKIGERAMAFFHATNLTGSATTGRAGYNVSPDIAGRYFKKIQCFCFNEQTLKPGETVSMPVTYFIDPAILDDKDARKIDEITLSYTFFPVDAPASARLEARRDR